MVSAHNILDLLSMPLPNLLSRSIIRTMKASPDVGLESAYTRNLAALVSRSIISNYNIIRERFLEQKTAAAGLGSFTKTLRSG